MAAPRKPFKPSDQILVAWNDDMQMRVAGRAPSNIGKQGDHVSAYHLIELLATSIAVESGLEVAVVRFFHYFDNLAHKLEVEIDNIQLDIQAAQDNESKNDLQILQKRYDQLSQKHIEITSIVNETKKQREVINKKDTEIERKILHLQILISAGKKTDEYKAFSGSDDAKNIQSPDNLFQDVANDLRNSYSKKVVENLVKTYLTICNKMPYTAIPSEGNIKTLSNEGTIVIQSCKKLATMSDELESKDPESLTESEVTTLSTIAAQNILNLFWFPKISSDILIDMTKTEVQKEWAGVVKAKGYTATTLPRDNNLDILCHVIANHINLILNCFPKFEIKESLSNAIIDKFINHVLNDGKINDIEVGWKLDETSSEKLKKDIMDLLYISGAYQPESRSSSKAKASSSDAKNESHTPSKEGSEQSNSTLIGHRLHSLSLDGNSDSDPDFAPPIVHNDEETADSSSIQTRSKTTNSQIRFEGKTEDSEKIKKKF